MIPKRTTARFLPFEEARKFMRGCSLKSEREWQDWCREGRRPAFIPSHPRRKYAQCGWNGLPDWLGYEGPANSCTNMAPSAPSHIHSQVAAGIRAKKIFLAVAGECPSFEFESLPHRSCAQFIYRNAHDEDLTTWCPLIIRSRERLGNPTAWTYFDIPREPLEQGVFFILREPEEIFFFPREYLKLHQLPLPAYVHKRDRRGSYKIPGADLGLYRVTGAAALKSLLMDRLQKMPPIVERDLHKLFPKVSDIVWQQAVQDAMEFLRQKCGLKVHRPFSSFLNAHMIVNDHPVWAKCGVRRHEIEHRDVFRVHFRWWTGGCIGAESFADRVKTGQPTFVLAMIRDEDDEGWGTKNAALRGMFIFPVDYLLSSGLLAIQGENVAAKYSFYVYPPEAKLKTSTAREIQTDQLNFFIDLSPATNAGAAAEKAARIFAKYGNEQTRKHA